MAMAQTQNKPVVNPALAYVAVIAGWLVPGLGHLILNRWKKALVYFLAVGSLAIAGMMMRGNVFSLDTADLFDRLGFAADLGSGLFYFLGHMLNPAGPDVSQGTLICA